MFIDVMEYLIVVDPRIFNGYSNRTMQHLFTSFISYLKKLNNVAMHFITLTDSAI